MRLEKSSWNLYRCVGMVGTAFFGASAFEGASVFKTYIHQKGGVAGDVCGNVQAVSGSYAKALRLGCDVCVAPELVTCGYFANDLLLRVDFRQAVFDANLELVLQTESTVLIFGTIIENRAGELNNVAIVAVNGAIVNCFGKVNLVDYGMFFESRYFVPARRYVVDSGLGSSGIFGCFCAGAVGFVRGVWSRLFSRGRIAGRNLAPRIGVLICRDVWHCEEFSELKSSCFDVVMVISASPFEKGKLALRLAAVARACKLARAPVVYCNQVLASDGIVLDGRSFVVYTERGQVRAERLSDVVDCGDVVCEFVGSLCGGDFGLRLMDSAGFLVDSKSLELTLADDVKFSDEIAEVYRVIVFSLREYFNAFNFSSVVIGLSGGLDSALTAKIAFDVAGSKRLKLFFLPSKFTSRQSLEDAEAVALGLGVKLEVVSIDSYIEPLSRDAIFRDAECGGEVISPAQELAYQNLQARIRGVLLTTIANSSNALLLTTGNRSELLTGYFTIYGDACGGFNPIKDLFKTEVYALSGWLNDQQVGSGGSVIPESVILKDPSAELAYNQKDSDVLPEYWLLDRILELYTDKNFGVDQVCDAVCGEFSDLAREDVSGVVARVIGMVRGSEWKRKQAAIGTLLTMSGVAEGCRRYPTLVKLDD